MGSLALHTYFNSPLPPHSSGSSSPTNWSRHVPVSVRIGWRMDVAPRFAKHRRWVDNNLWKFCTQKPRATSLYLRGPLAHYEKRDDPSPPQKKQKTEEPKNLAEFVEGRKRKLDELERNAQCLDRQPSYQDSLKKQSSPKYGNQSLKESEEHYKDVEDDLIMRLEIVEKSKFDILLLAFEESIGSQLQKLSGTQEQILERFTSQLKRGTKIKLKRSTKIAFVRRPGHILQIKIDDEEIVSIRCEPLNRSLSDLYIGEDPLHEE